MVGANTHKRREALSINRRRAKQMRHKPVSLEKLFWSEVRSRKLGGFKFRRQFLVGQYIGDFVCVAQKVVVELDGPFHADRAKYDVNRDAFLQSCGYRVLRFSNSYVAGDIGTVLSIVRHTLSAGSPSP